MKLFKHLFIAFALLFTFQSQAQYCGSQDVSLGSGGCSYQINFGFGNVDSFTCITRGQYDSLIIPFKVYQQFVLPNNSTATIYKLKFDAIDSLPCGLCWSISRSLDTSNTINEFDPADYGCIKIKGITNDRAGSYRLHISLAVRYLQTTTSGYDIDTIPSDAGGITLWVKVTDAGGNCPMTIDTISPAHTSCVTTGINEIARSLSALSLAPNPMSTSSRLTFHSEISGSVRVRISNIVGAELYSAPLTVKTGNNETTINRGNLPPGIYIVSVGNSQGTVSEKLIITE